MKPWEISDRDLAIIEGQLAEQCRLNQDPLHCLEWGAGGSTIQFPEFLHKLGHSFDYVSIEYNLAWYQKVVGEISARSLSSVQVRLEQCDGNPHKEPMDSYVDYPLTLGKRFNFMFVDGRKRRRCLLVASRLLAPGGVVILHDAEREWYHSAFQEFTNHSQMGDKLWIGRMD